MSRAPQPPPEPVLWINGEFCPLSRAAISPLDRGLLYGDGLFETLRAQEGRVAYLEAHLERLRASAAFLGLGLGEEPDWASLLPLLLALNGLEKGAARLKIVLTRGQAPELGLPAASRPTLLAQAWPYAPPPAEAYEQGWRLHAFSQPAPALAGHKTLNYLYYLWARQEAQGAGAQEALILDQAGQVAETAAGSLLCRQEGRWWTPASPSQLPGVTLAQARRLLAAQGHMVEARPASLAELAACPTVWVLNSLMGVMPVSHLAGQALADPASSQAASLRARLWAGE